MKKILKKQWLNILISLGILILAFMVAFACYSPCWIGRATLIISAFGAVIIPSMIWYFGSVRADAQKEYNYKKNTIKMVTVDLLNLGLELIDLSNTIKKIDSGQNETLAICKKFKESLYNYIIEKDNFFCAVNKSAIRIEFDYKFAFERKDIVFVLNDSLDFYGYFSKLELLINRLNQRISLYNEQVEKNAEKIANKDITTKEASNDFKNLQKYNNQDIRCIADLVVQIVNNLGKHTLPAIYNFILENFENDFKNELDIILKLKKSFSSPDEKTDDKK